jgi:uncharacterized membrane protein YebE (DUF533 family)
VSGPYVEQTGKVGVDLRFRTQIAQAVQRGSGNDWLAADYVLDIVRAEVAAAEERGRVEGAAKERERIAAEVRELFDTTHGSKREFAASVADLLDRWSS